MIEENIWRFIPWIWSLKTTEIFVDNNNLCVQGFNLPLDLMIQILSTVLLFIGIVIWFKSGRKNKRIKEKFAWLKY